jgi:hypothetical protein
LSASEKAAYKMGPTDDKKTSKKRATKKRKVVADSESESDSDDDTPIGQANVSQVKSSQN